MSIRPGSMTAALLSEHGWHARESPKVHWVLRDQYVELEGPVREYDIVMIYGDGDNWVWLVEPDGSWKQTSLQDIPASVVKFINSQTPQYYEDIRDDHYITVRYANYRVTESVRNSVQEELRGRQARRSLRGLDQAAERLGDASSRATAHFRGLSEAFARVGAGGVHNLAISASYDRRHTELPSFQPVDLRIDRSGKCTELTEIDTHERPMTQVQLREEVERLRELMQPLADNVPNYAYTPFTRRVTRT